MTTDRALELAGLALNMRRASAKHTGQPAIEREAEEALRLVAELRAIMPSVAPQGASEALEGVNPALPTAEPSEELRTPQECSRCGADLPSYCTDPVCPDQGVDR